MRQILDSWSTLGKAEQIPQDCFIFRLSENEYYYRIYDKDNPEILVHEGSTTTQAEAEKEIEKWTSAI